MLIPQRCKPMVSAHEQVLSGDARLVIKGRLVRFNIFTQFVPQQLHLMRDFPPRGQGTPVNVQRRSLGGRTRIPAVGALPVVAFAVPVIKRHFTYGAVGV